MKNLIISIKKLIPAYFEIRSLYWVQYEKAMNEELKSIFEKIDMDDYSAAENLIKEFELKHHQGTVPLWVGLKMAEIHRAQSMLVFLKSEIEDTISDQNWEEKINKMKSEKKYEEFFDDCQKYGIKI